MLQSENLDKALKIKLSEWNEDDSKKYMDFYEEIPNEDLGKILSIYHYKINNLLEYLNSRLYNGHFTAQESRELIYISQDLDRFNVKLKGTKFEFEMKQYYVDILSKCKSFLQTSGGSPIPNDFKAIDIVDFEPLFSLKQHTKIKNNNVTYKIKPIGGGSYADVFKYRDEYYNKTFVIKRAKNNLREDEYKRFKVEFEETKKLNSPYIVEVYNFDEENHEYTMEYMDKTLERYILENNNKLSYTERINIVTQISKAFKYIHNKGVFHRDISTKNILVKIYEDIVVAKISDFGLVKLQKSNLTRQGTEIKGSLNDHHNLEIVGFDNYRMIHETYALTKLIYFIMTGRTSLERYDKTKYKEFVRRGISPNIEERYSSIDELKEAFSAIKE